ncbi:MAG: hypothetical protein LBS56_05560 [Propionibacteriaceae bacterium]|nr:hypothetical protein [Propionibacteriaceae bacterium]
MAARNATPPPSGGRTATSGTLEGVVIALVGPWELIALRPPAARAKAVRDLVDRQVAGLQIDPALRRQLITLMDQQTAQAAETGVRLMGMLTMGRFGLPLAATLLATRLPVVFADQAEAVAFAERMAASYGPAAKSADVAQGEQGLIVRVVTERDAPVPGGPVGEEAVTVPQTLFHYAIDLGDGAGVVSLTFSTPNVEFKDAWQEYFDKCADAVYSTAPPAADGPEAGGAEAAGPAAERPESGGAGAPEAAAEAPEGSGVD